MSDSLVNASLPDQLISGPEIDRDLGITPRTRSTMVADGRLPKPAGRLGVRFRWRLSEYLAARERLLQPRPTVERTNIQQEQSHA